MKQASAKRLWADKLVQASSAVLASSWVAYLAYMSITHIDKQSVYLGPITFYSAVLFAITAVALLVMLTALGTMAYRRDPALKRSTYLVLGATLLMAAVYAATEVMVRRAIGN